MPDDEENVEADHDEEQDDEDEAEEEPEPEPEETGPEPLTTVTEYTRTEYALRKDEVPVHPLAVHLKSMERIMPIPESITPIVEKYGEAMEAHAADESKPVPTPVFAAELPEAERLDPVSYTHLTLPTIYSV